MAVCYLKRNYRQVRLDEFTKGEVVGVMLRNGNLRYLRWLGFIGRNAAQALGAQQKARPVLLDLYSYQPGDDPVAPRVVVGASSYIQGCQIDAGVYAVLDGGSPRVVTMRQQAE